MPAAINREGASARVMAAQLYRGLRGTPNLRECLEYPSARHCPAQRELQNGPSGSRTALTKQLIPSRTTCPAKSQPCCRTQKSDPMWKRADSVLMDVQRRPRVGGRQICQDNALFHSSVVALVSRRIPVEGLPVSVSRCRKTFRSASSSGCPCIRSGDFRRRRCAACFPLAPKCSGWWPRLPNRTNA